MAARVVPAPFDLCRDPLIRLTILRESDTVTYAYVQYHHILTDAWGINLYMWQVRTDYAHVLRTGEPAPLDPPSYLAYAQRERGYPDSDRYRVARDFFRPYLDGVQPALFTRRAPNGSRRTGTETVLIRREVIHGRRRVPRRHPRHRSRKGGTTGSEGSLIPLSSNEIRRLFAHLALTVRYRAGHILHWSQFRRRRQEQARAAHYRKRLEPP